MDQVERGGQQGWPGSGQAFRIKMPQACSARCPVTLSFIPSFVLPVYESSTLTEPADVDEETEFAIRRPHTASA